LKKKGTKLYSNALKRILKEYKNIYPKYIENIYPKYIENI